MENHNEISYPCEGNSSCFQVEDHSFWFRQRNKIIEFVVRKFAKSGTFADVGGGNGYVSTNLSKNLQDLDFILVEPGSEGCQNARRRGLKKVFNKTLNELHEFQTLDNIGIFDVIEHIQDDEKFLKDISSKLSPGGRLFITTPAYNWLWSCEDSDAGHFRRYSKSEIERKSKNNGFRIIYSSYFFFNLILPIFLLRVFPEKIGIKKKRDLSADHGEGKLSKALETILGLEIFLMKIGLKFPIGASVLLCLEKAES